MTDVSEFTVHMPDASEARLDQDSEWCVVETADGRRRIRLHDYADIYAIPGLYERLFYDVLRCSSKSRWVARTVSTKRWSSASMKPTVASSRLEASRLPEP